MCINKRMQYNNQYTVHFYLFINFTKNPFPQRTIDGLDDLNENTELLDHRPVRPQDPESTGFWERRSLNT